MGPADAEEPVFGDTAAVDLDVRGRPDFPHIRLTPQLDALAPGLQERHHDQALLIVHSQIRTFRQQDSAGSMIAEDAFR